MQRKGSLNCVNSSVHRHLHNPSHSQRRWWPNIWKQCPAGVCYYSGPGLFLCGSSDRSGLHLTYIMHLLKAVDHNLPVQLTIPLKTVHPSGAVRHHMLHPSHHMSSVVDKNILHFPHFTRSVAWSHMFSSVLIRKCMHLTPLDANFERRYVTVKSVAVVIFVPLPALLSTRRPAHCSPWHGQRDSGWISGCPSGQRHGGTPGWIVRDYNSHCEVEWCQRQPPSLQTE